MATKRTKGDRARRQADRLEKEMETRVGQVPRKRPPRQDFSRAAKATTMEPVQQSENQTRDQTPKN